MPEKLFLRYCQVKSCLENWHSSPSFWKCIRRGRFWYILIFVLISFYAFFSTSFGSVKAEPREEVNYSEIYTSLSEEAVEIVSDRTWNQKVFDNGDGTKQYIISSGYMHYEDENGDMQNIDTNITQSLDNEDFEMSESIYQAKFKKDISNDNFIHIQKEGEGVSLSLGELAWKNTNERQVISLPQEVQGQTDNNTITYPNAYGEGLDFSFQADDTKLSKKLTIPSLESLPIPNENILNGKEPSLELQVEFELDNDMDIFIDGKLWNKEEIQLTGKALEFKKDGETIWGFAPPKAWDSQENMGNIIDGTTTISIDEKKLNLTISFPYSWLKTAQYPVTIDPDTYYGETTDGFITGQDDDYGTARSTSTSFSTDLTTFKVGQFQPLPYAVMRSYLEFDTSGIDDGDTVTQANLWMTVSQDESDIDFTLRVHKYQWASPIDAGNREANYDGALASTFGANWRDTSAGVVLNTPYESSNLDVNWVEKGATLTQYALLSDQDIGATYLGEAYLILFSQENATQAYRPYLSITVTSPATRYWIDNDGGNWNDTANWSDSSGGAGSQSVPVAGDTAIFDNAGGTHNGALTIDTAVDVDTLTFDTNYTGTITQGANTITTTTAMSLTGQSLTMGADLTASGTLTIASGKTIDLNGHNLTVTSTFTNNGTLKLQGGETATLTNDSAHGTVEYTGTSGPYTLKSWDYFALKINAAATTFNQPAALTVNGAFNLAAGIYSQGADQNLTVKDDFTIASSGSTFTKGTGTSVLILDGTPSAGTFTGPATAQNLGAVQIGLSPGTTDLAADFAADSLTINAADIFNTNGYEVDIGSGGITLATGAPGGTLDTTDNGGAGYEGDGTIITDAGNFTIGAGGVFTKCVQATRRSLVKMDGGATKTLTSSSQDIGDFQISMASTHIDLQDALNAGSLTIDANATFDPKTYNLTVTGAFSSTGDFGITGIKPSGVHTFSGSWTNNTGGTFYLSSNATATVITDNVTCTGTLSATSNGSLTLNGATINFTGGTYTKGTGTVKFSRGAAQTLTIVSGLDLGVVQISTASTNVSVSPAWTELKVTTLTIDALTTFDISTNRILNITGTGTGASRPFQKSGTLVTSNSTVKYTGSGADTDIETANYRNLTLTPTSATTYNQTANYTGANSIDGQFTISNTNATFDPKTYDLTVGSDFVCYGNFGIAAAKPSGVHIFNGSIWQFSSGTYYLSSNATPTVIAGSTSTTVSSGNIDATSNGSLTLNGAGLDFTYTGTFTKGTGTLKFNRGAAMTLNIGNGAGDLGAVQTSTASTSVTVYKQNAGEPKLTSLKIDASTIFNITSRTLTITGTGTPLVNSGTFTTTGSTVIYTGTTTATNIATVAYNNLTLTPTGATTYTLTGDLTVGNAMTGNLTNNANATLDIVNGSNYGIELAGNWANSGTFEARSGTVTFSAGAAGKTLAGTMTGTSAFNNLTFNNGSGGWTLSNDIKVGSVLDINAGTFNASNKTVELAGSGTPFVKTGTFNKDTSTFKYTYAGDINVTAANYFNLELVDPPVGPNSPGTMADDGAIGTKAWSNVDNAKTSNDSYAATAAMTAWDISHYLKATNFGFSIPSGATIDGILVEIERKKSGTDNLGDYEVKIVLADGSLGTENKAIATNWVTSEAYYSYGDSSDLWSESWSAANINDADFGVVLSVKDEQTIPSGNDATPQVDHIRITVDYTEPPPVYTLSSGTFDIDGYLTIGNSVDTMEVTAATNNPVIDLEGDMTITANSTFTASGSAAFNAAGSWANSGTFTAGTGTVTFDGTADQDINGSLTTATNGAFYNLILANEGAFGSDDIILGADLDITGDLTLTDGDFNLGSYTTTLDGNLSIATAASTAYGTSTFIFDGVSKTISGTRTFILFYDLTVNPGKSITVNDSVEILTYDDVLIDGTMVDNVGMHAAGSNFTVNDTYTLGDALTMWIDLPNCTINGTFTVGAGTLVNFVDSDQVLNIGDGGVLGGTPGVDSIFQMQGDADPDINLTGTGNFDSDLYLRFYLLVDNFALPSLNYQAGKVEVYGTFIGDSTTYTVTPTAGTLDIDGDFSLSCEGTMGGAPIIEFDNNSANVSINIGGSFTLTGSGSGIAKYTKGTETITFDAGSGSHTFDPGSLSTFNDIVFNDSAGGADWTLSSTSLDVNGNFTITSGTFDANNLAMNITGNWTNSDTFTAGSSTVTFNKGVGTQTLNSGGTGTSNLFNNLTHSGAGTLQLDTNALDVDGNFINSNGTFDANDLDINVANDWTISGGSFEPKSGGGATTQTVTFDTTNPSAVSGNTTFNNLTMDASVDGAKTITFTAGSRQTIPTSTKTWTLNGSAGNVLTLRSSAPGTPWLFEIDANMSAGDYIDVQDSQNTTTPSRITVGGFNCTNSGNNIPGWIFSAFGPGGPGPANVLNFSAEAGNKQVVLSWTNPSSFTAVIIQRSTSTFPGTVYDGDTIYHGSGTSDIDTDLTNDITHYYTAFGYVKPGSYSSGAIAQATPFTTPEDLIDELVDDLTGYGYLPWWLRTGEAEEEPEEDITKVDIEFKDFSFFIKKDLDWMEVLPLEEYHIFPNDDFKLEIDKDIFHKEVESITVRFGSKTYEAKVVDGKYQILGKTPGLKGSYQIIIEIVYKDGETKTISQDVLIDPYGYIFKKSRSFWDSLLQKEEYEETRILNAKVTLYSYNQTKRDWQTWDAQEYNQINPQITNQSGEYSFMTPKGRYYLEVEKAGYKKYQTEEFEVKDEIVNKNIEIQQATSNGLIYILAVLFLVLIIIVIIIYRGRRRPVDNYMASSQ